ncbi:MAG TPA: thioredoxin family protein [Longimicrobiales bacterium]|nr:thioredoxin family protein [Longimicrobiales bacterium]
MTMFLLFLALLGADPRLEALWRDGITFTVFQRDSEVRREILDRNAALAAAVPADLLARARAVEGTWRFLVVAVDGCSDSVNSIPFLAALADSAGFEVRIIDRERGRALMEENRTPDGRAATPTVILLNDRFDNVGVWVERPAALQTWLLENPEKLPNAQLFERKMKWYDDDGGRSSLVELVELLERAAARVE